MTSLFHDIIFGPVHSRRLGLSLGVNLLPLSSKLCSFDCIYCECGWKWGLLWYAAVAALAALLAPEKEAAVLFVFFGYYPMLRKLIGRLRVRAAAWAVKLVYVNAAVFAAYGLMLYVFHLTAVMEDFAGMGKAMLAVLLVLANVTFVIYDVLIARLEIYYHVRLRPKLHL